MPEARPISATPAADEEPDEQPVSEALADMPLPSEPQPIFLAVLLVLALLAAAYVARSIAMPLVFALMLKLTLQPLMRMMEKLRAPRIVAALLIIAALLAAIVLLGAAVAGPAGAWIARLPDDLPKIQARLTYLREPVDLTLKFFQQVEGIGSSEPLRQSPVAFAEAEALGVLFSGAQGFVGELFTTILFLFFLLIAGDQFLRRLVEILPGFSAKRQAVDITMQIESDIGAYLETITIMNALVGAATAGAMHWLGVGDALLWGLVAFALNFAPIIGPTIGICIFAIVGLLTSENIWHALAPAASYFCIHLAEGEAITPMLLARRFTVNPLLVIVSLVFWFWMWGIPGAILSAPMLASLKIVCDRVRPLAALGHLLEA